MEEMIWRTHIPIFSHYLLDTTLFFSQILHEFSYGLSFHFFLKASKPLIGLPTNSRELPGVLFVWFASRIDRDRSGVDATRSTCHWSNAAFVSISSFYHSRSIRYLHVISPAWKATHDFRASSPRPTRIISANVLVVVMVCLHSRDDWFFLHLFSFLYAFSCSSGQHFFHCKNHLNLGLPNHYEWVNWLVVWMCEWFIRRPTNIDLGMCFFVLFLYSFFFLFFLKRSSREGRCRVVTSFLTYVMFACLLSRRTRVVSWFIPLFSVFASLDGRLILCVIFIKTVSRNYMHGHMSRSYVCMVVTNEIQVYILFSILGSTKMACDIKW